MQAAVPTRRPALRRALRRWTAALLMLLATPAFAGVADYELKAAFIFNFLNFVEWPSPPGGAVGVCVMGDDKVAATLEYLNASQKSAMDVRKIGGADQMTGCQILFIGRDRAGSIGELLGQAKGRSVLTVSDAEGFADKGGLIEFTSSDGKIAMRISNTGAQQAGLRISAQMLALAEEVK